jgi:hypothetical protein
MNSAIGLVTKKPLKAHAHEEVVSPDNLLIKILVGGSNFRPRSSWRNGCLKS